MSNNVTLRPDYINVSQELIHDSYTDGYRKDLFRWVSIVNLEWDNHKLPVIVIANSKVEDRSEKGRKKWAVFLTCGAAESAKTGNLTAFDENNITHRIFESSSAEYPDSITVDVPPAFIERIDEQCDIHCQATKGFQEIVVRLRELIGYGGVSFEARTLFHYIERWLDAGFLGHMYSWYEEKRTRIRRNMQDMERRKNRNHEGYISDQEDLISQLSSFSPPYAWLRQPPLVDLATARSSNPI